jgi:hypothetical protein
LPDQTEGNAHELNLSPSRVDRRRGFRRDRLTRAGRSPASAQRRSPPGSGRVGTLQLGSYQITVATDGQRSFKLPDILRAQRQEDQ